MMPIFAKGDPWPENAWFNALLAAAKWGALGGVGPGLERSGTSLALAQTPRIWAKLSGPGNPYAFVEQIPTAGGFSALANGRTDDAGRSPAFEVNKASGLGGTYQILRWTAAGDWRFQAQGAGPGGGGTAPPPIILPACFCPVPPVLTMTSANPSCNYAMFQSCTITYQATPAWAANLGLGPMIFLSTTSFPDPISGANFYYYLSCQYNQFNLTRLYPVSPYGTPYRDALLYSWLLGGYNTSCNPFRLDGGKPYPGSDQSCLVSINTAS